jgi:hypothetical protein
VIVSIENFPTSYSTVSNVQRAELIPLYGSCPAFTRQEPNKMQTQEIGAKKSKLFDEKKQKRSLHAKCQKKTPQS